MRIDLILTGDYSFRICWLPDAGRGTGLAGILSPEMKTR